MCYPINLGVYTGNLIVIVVSMEVLITITHCINYLVTHVEYSQLSIPKCPLNYQFVLVIQIDTHSSEQPLLC